MHTPLHTHYPHAARPGQSAFILVGPTAVGKTTVAHALAAADHLDILSADSMLVYRGMDIGTAKPTRAERDEVRYWGLDLVEPHQAFSAGAYLEEAARALAAASQRGLPLIVTGGTGLYIRALTAGLDRGGPAPEELRGRLAELHRREGVAGLRAELERRAPGRPAELTDPMNPRRLLRALELADAEGSRRGEAVQRASPPRMVGLRMPRSALVGRIAARVERMYREGLLEEAERLRAQDPELSETAREAIGYREAFDVLDGRLTEAEAGERTVVRTRQLAKRQMTWFRNQAEVTWVEVAPGDAIGDIAGRVRRAWEEGGPTSLAGQ